MAGRFNSHPRPARRVRADDWDTWLTGFEILMRWSLAPLHEESRSAVRSLG